MKKFPIKFAKTFFKLPVISWALYDFANTAFAVVIITIIFPVYFTNIIAPESLYGKNFGDLMWGISLGVSMIIAAFLAPVFGTIADQLHFKNKFLIILTCISIIFTALLYFTGYGNILAAMIFFIIANIFYQLSMLFYNSFLPELSDKDNVGNISGFGFALGYLGGLIILLIIYFIFGKELTIENIKNLKIIFIFTAAYFLIFSLPSFLFLKDKNLKLSNIISKTVKPEHQDKKTANFLCDNENIIKFNKVSLVGFINSYITPGFQMLSYTFKRVKTDRNLLTFLISFFLFSNAFSILATYSAIYGKNTLNLSLRELTFLFILGHFPVIISSFFFGWLVDKLGSKKVIILTLIIWSIIIILITLANVKVIFYIVFVLASVITGSTLIAARSLMSFLTPIESEAGYFSFYSIGGKVSSILGPVLFGLISFLTKSQRIAFFCSTLLFLISGLILMIKVKVPEKREGQV